TNEELQSTNEELQSTNEELETSKEELQSINEELVTVNSELQNKVDELAGAGNDMFNLLTATESAILFLDNNLKVRRFTPSMTQVMNLMPGDVGRTVSGIATYLAEPDLTGDIEEVLRTLAFREKEVFTRQGQWYRMRISPYRTLDNMIDGVVIVFTEITEAKRAAERSEAALRYAENIIATIREPLLVLDKQFRVVSANESYYRTFRVRKDQVIGERVYSLGNQEWNIPSLRVLLEEVLSKGATIEDYPVSHTFKEVGFKQMRLNARKVKTTGQIIADADELILLAIESQSDAHPPPPAP
ncbi:MAG TPA: PAS domain-containing protein, partial [Candidatus Manganitrophaceae bacterium]|nr:PAS domain-containing protein [Candidatus Manganitrophaceae bacterium]